MRLYTAARRVPERLAEYAIAKYAGNSGDSKSVTARLPPQRTGPAPKAWTNYKRSDSQQTPLHNPLAGLGQRGPWCGVGLTKARS